MDSIKDITIQLAAVAQELEIFEWQAADTFLAPTSSLIPILIREFHNSGHEGFDKTLYKLKDVFYWSKIKDNIKQFIKECDICQKNKMVNLVPAGLLHPLPIPEQVWLVVSMDFIGLLKSNGKSVIMVVVDRLHKYTHFLPLSHPYSAVHVAKIFYDNIFKLHGLPTAIVCVWRSGLCPQISEGTL